MERLNTQAGFNSQTVLDSADVIARATIALNVTVTSYHRTKELMADRFIRLSISSQPGLYLEP
jgi:phosphoribosylcarboxyaminoimidazole (NCAIR) mutase